MHRSGIEYAAATPTWGGYSKNCHNWVVTTWKRPGSASKAGEPNSAMASRNTRMKAARMAGSTSGSVIEKVVRRLPEPRMFAASSISEETRSSADLVNTNT